LAGGRPCKCKALSSSPNINNSNKKIS
jgi:hypothetical protein